MWRRRKQDEWTLEKQAKLATIGSYKISGVSLWITILSVVIAALSVIVAVVSIHVTIWLKDGIDSVEDRVNDTREAIERGVDVLDRFADPWIASGLRNNGGGDYVQGIEARPGDIIEAQIYVRNTTGQPVDLVTWVNIPSNYLSIVPNSVRRWDSHNADVLFPESVDITRPINLGKFQQYDPDLRVGWFTIAFQLQIEEAAADRVGSRIFMISEVAGYDNGGRLATNAVGFTTHIDIIAD